MKNMKIFLISSKEFSNKLPTIKFNLQKEKHEVSLPTFDIGKTNEKNIKQIYMKKDLQKIEACQGILVCNFKKKIEKYIGPTTLVYMGVAFYLNKKIYLLYDLPDTSNLEEIKSFSPTCLLGDIKKIKKDEYK